MPAKRDWVLAAATVVALSGGTSYVFSSYAPQLAGRLGLTSTQTNAVGAAGNLGVYLSSPLVGRVVDRRGPLPPLIFAAFALTSGYLLIRGFYLGADAPESLYGRFGVSGLALAELLVGIGSTAALSAAGNTVAKSYKKKRAAALSVVLSAFGLSAFFYSTLSSFFLHSRTSSSPSSPPRDTTADFLLMLAVGCSISMLVGILFVRPVPHPSLSAPPAGPAPPATSAAPSSVDEVAVSSSLPEDEQAPQTQTSERTPLLRSASTKSVEVRNIAGLALLRELDFYLIFLFNGLCAGIGLCYINNLGSVVRSLALSSTTPLSPPSPASLALTQSRLVSLLSFCNFLGRLLSGFGSDYLVHHPHPGRRVTRVWWLVFTGCLYTASQVAAVHATRVDGWMRGLWAPTVLTGLAHGSLFGISGIIGLERFGMASFSSTNGILALAPALFGQTTNLLFGRIYDSHTPSTSPSLLALLPTSLSSTAAAGATCTAGRDCYVSTFRITTGMGVAAVGVGLVLATVRRGMKVRAA
ncbi:hypothetical protein JCM8097_005341 [Rhodosporidiobolus ruineniae]